jgi:hypothetical protein
MNENNSNYTYILFLIYVLIFFFAIYGSPFSMTNNISSSGNSIFSNVFIIVGMFFLLIYFIILILFGNTNQIFKIPFNQNFIILILITSFIILIIILMFYMKFITFAICIILLFFIIAFILNNDNSSSFFEIIINPRNFIIIFISIFIYFFIISLIYLNSKEHFESFSPEPIKESSDTKKSIPNINSIPGGTCITNKNKFGYLINNVCVEQNRENIDQISQKTVEETPEKKILKTQDNLLKTQEKTIPDNNFVGICILPNKKFGYKIPVLGKKCYSQKEFQKYMETIKQKNVLVKKEKEEEQKIDIAKENLSKCGLDKNTNFDKYCKEKYGEDFGMKEIFKCKNNSYQVQCAKNFSNGKLLPNNITGCINKNRDLNYICTNELIKNNSNILTGGYKEIYKNTCSSGDDYRLICDENYYNGIPLYINATPCYFQGSNFDRYCKNIYGENYKLDKIISGNCRVGYLKGICKKI